MYELNLHTECGGLKHITILCGKWLCWNATKALCCASLCTKPYDGRTVGGEWTCNAHNSTCMCGIRSLDALLINWLGNYPGSLHLHCRVLLILQRDLSSCVKTAIAFHIVRAFLPEIPTSAAEDSVLVGIKLEQSAVAITQGFWKFV